MNGQDKKRKCIYENVNPVSACTPETVKETKDSFTAQSLLLGELTCYDTSGNISHHTVQDTSDDP